MTVSVHSPEPLKRQADTPLPTQPATAFLWAGVASLVMAAAVGIQTALSMAGGGPVVLTGWMIAVLCIIAGFGFLIAHTRQPIWQRLAGVTEPHWSQASAQAVRRAEMKIDLLVVAFLLTVAATPRLMALMHSLWFDEIWTLSFMREGPLGALSQQSGYNNHLLNSVLGSICLTLYSLLRGEDIATLMPPPWVVRIPAFLFGMASVAALYAAVRLYAERPVAITAAALLALSPAAVDYSAQTRGYSALIFFTILQAHFLTRAMRSGEAAPWVWWIVCAVLGTLSHLYFTLVVAVNLLFLLGLSLYDLLYLRDRPRSRVLIEQGGLMSLIWLAFCGIVYSRVGALLLETMTRQSKLPPVAVMHDLLLPTLQRWGGIPKDGSLIVFLIVCLMLSALGIWHLSEKSLGAAIYLPMLIVCPPILVELLRPHYVYSRFFAFALPAFLTLIACGLWQTTQFALGPKHEDSPWKEPVLVLLTVGFVFLTLPGLRDVMLLPKQDYTHAAERLQEEQERGRVVAAVGLGSSFFSSYLPSIKILRTEEELSRLLRSGKTVVVADTGLVSHPGMKSSRVVEAVRARGGIPMTVYPGRLADWPYRWVDGNSDISLYRLEGMASSARTAGSGR